MAGPALNLINCPDCGSHMAGKYDANPPKVPKAVVLCANCGLMDLEENWMPQTTGNFMPGIFLVRPVKPVEICHICKESPHNTSCGMWTPYPKG